MADFIRHEPSTFVIYPASLQVLRIDYGTQPQKRFHRDLRLFCNNQHPAITFIEHPARHHDSQFLLTLHDNRRINSRPEPANHLNFTAKKWMEPVGDPRQIELMSSVLMRCAIRSPPTYSNPAPTSALFKAFSAMWMSPPP